MIYWLRYLFPAHIISYFSVVQNLGSQFYFVWIERKNSYINASEIFKYK